MKTLRIGLVGSGFVCKAHALAYRSAVQHLQKVIDTIIQSSRAPVGALERELRKP